MRTSDSIFIFISRLIVCLLALPSNADARLDGRVYGKVCDPAGVAIYGVKVVATAVSGTSRQETITDQGGFYQLQGLPKGTYNISFEKSEFNRLVKRNQTVADYESTEINITLQISSVSSISGEITDPQGAVISDAKIIATNTETGDSYVTTTDESGVYRLDLPTGTYSFETEKAGFKRMLITDVFIGPDKPLNMPIAMQIGSVPGVVVTASAEDPSIDVTNTTIGTVLDRQKVSELPYVNRNPYSLVILAPAATGKTNSGENLGFSVNGSRGRENNFVVDGAETSQPDYALVPFNLLPLDAVQQLSVTSHFGADFGRYSGGLISTVTRAGGNDFHGSATYSHRNSALGARDFFDLDKSHSLKHEFGFTIGGPIRRDQTFFFAAFEGVRDLDARPRLVSVPSADTLAQARSMLASKGLVENPLSTEILRLFPTPGRPGAFNNLTNNSPSINNTDSFLLRIDHRIRSNDNVYGWYRINQQGALFPAAPSFLPGFRTDLAQRDQAFLVAYSKAFRAKYFNELRFLYNRNRQALIPEDIAFNPSTLGLNTEILDPERFGLPFIKVTGFDALGAPFSLPLQDIRTTWQVINNFAVVNGAHSIKSGFDFRRLFSNSHNDSGTRGRIVFDGSVTGDPLIDFLAGLPSGNTAIVRGRTQRGLAINSGSLYLQDDYKPHKTLFLSMGLRYEFNGVVQEERNRLSNLLPESLELVRVGSERLPKLYNNDLNNFAPRLAINWDPSGEGDWLIRANWGIFYDSPSTELFNRLGPFRNSANSGATLNPVEPDAVFAISPPQPAPFGPGVPIFGEPSKPDIGIDLFAVEQGLRTPYYSKFFLGFQRKISRDMLFDISYTGSIGNKLYRIIDINQPTPGDPGTKNMRRPFSAMLPQVRAINTIISAGKSNYHALGARLERRFAKGLYFQAGYILSKFIDDASTANEVPQDSRNLRAERALSNFDQRHRFLLSWIYEFPWSENKILTGWQVSGLLRAETGNPFNPVISFDNSGTGMFVDRPTLIRDARPRSQERTLWLDPEAFLIPPQGSFGNLGRNSLTGPGQSYLDISIKKSIRIGQDKRFEIRVDLFNVTNHPNFLPPNTFVDEPGFGRLTATEPITGRRRIQIGVKFLF